jgi:hypothetical protein
MAQSGGDRSFNFIDVAQCPRVTGLGGSNITLSDADGNMFLSNPGLLSEGSHGQASFNHYFYYSGVRFNSFSYVHTIEKTGTWGLGVQQAGYGNLESFDPSGNSLGTVQAGEYAIVLGNAHRAGNFIMGGNLKFAFSNIASYRASAFMADIGGVFKHPSQDLTLGLVIHNLGFIMHDYTETSSSRVPFDVRAGITFKPEHMPFRFSITFQHLTQGNILYDNSLLYANQDKPSGFDKIFSHIVIGSELILNKNLSFFGGFNHLIRKELSLQQVSGGAGFSYGLMIKIKAFSLSYAGAFYHVAGGTHHLGLSVNTSTFYKRKKVN